MSDDRPLTSDPFRFTLYLPALLSCVSLLVAIAGLVQLDLSLSRFIRAIDVEWFEEIGRVGKLLGSWPSLVGISLALFLMGHFAHRPTLRLAGVQTLIAHGAAALAVQTLKHVIARPRPRLADTHEYQFGPSFVSGFDSFPSGHAMASFAIATVVAKHFPQSGWIAYGIAALIGASRVITGSHFPSDIVAGLVMGTLIGSIVANPIRAWRDSLRDSLVRLSPYALTVFALVWIACYVSPEDRYDKIMFMMGTSLILFGAMYRLWSTRLKGAWSRYSGPSFANSLIVTGLSMTTGSILVTGLALLLCLAQWLASDHRNTSAPSLSPHQSQSHVILTEAALAIVLLAAVILVRQMKGIIPLP